jgi:hypothetical protein
MPRMLNFWLVVHPAAAHHANLMSALGEFNRQIG